MASSSFKATRRSAWYTLVQNVGLILLATLASALLALLIEDAIPNPDAPSPAVVWARVAATAFVLAALGLVIMLRRRRWQARGTLFYIRYLDEWMEDSHLDQFQGARDNHLDARVVAGWMSARPDRSRLIDVADDLAELGNRLQLTMNEDDISTAFNLAPNMLYPMALSVGYDLYMWPEARFEEALRQGDLQPRLSWRIDDTPPAGSTEPVIADSMITEARSSLVTVRLTHERDTKPINWPIGRHYDVRVPSVTTGRRADDKDIRPVSISGDDLKPHQIPFNASAGLSAVVHPTVAARVTVEAIRRALHERPNGPVYLFLRLPKTVALAVGWQLANPSQRTVCKELGHDGCRSPWTRLMPLMIDQVDRTASPMVCRVHRAQPCLPVLERRMRTGEVDYVMERKLHNGCDCPDGRTYPK